MSNASMVSRQDDGATLSPDSGTVVPLFEHLGPNATFLGAARDFCRHVPEVARSVMPPLAVALARAAGWDAALSLVWACGGRTVELPAAVRVGRSWLALAVGADAARAMLPVLEDRASDSGRINLPSRATVTASIRIACVGYLSDQGHSRARIASVLGLSERTVYRHLSKRRNDQSPKE